MIMTLITIVEMDSSYDLSASSYIFASNKPYLEVLTHMIGVFEAEYNSFSPDEDKGRREYEKRILPVIKRLMDQTSGGLMNSLERLADAYKIYHNIVHNDTINLHVEITGFDPEVVGNRIMNLGAT